MLQYHVGDSVRFCGNKFAMIRFTGIRKIRAVGFATPTGFNYLIDSSNHLFSSYNLELVNSICNTYSYRYKYVKLNIKF
jgi:hypothetical protein